LKLKIPKPSWKFGVRYHNGKLLFFKADSNGSFHSSSNPRTVAPSWAVDIREILAMVFAGTGALILLFKGYVTEAMYILIGLTNYAIGRTVPGGKQIVYREKSEE